MLSIILIIGNNHFDEFLDALCGGWLFWVIDLAPCSD